MIKDAASVPGSMCTHNSNAGRCDEFYNRGMDKSYRGQGSERLSLKNQGRRQQYFNWVSKDGYDLYNCTIHPKKRRHHDIAVQGATHTLRTDRSPMQLVSEMGNNEEEKTGVGR